MFDHAEIETNGFGGLDDLDMFVYVGVTLQTDDAYCELDSLL